MSTNKNIHAFAVKWTGIFKAGHIRRAEAEMGDECDALGFIMDAGNEMNRRYPEAMSGAEKLRENLEQIDDIKVLGSGIYSQWRYYQHWAQSPWDTEWFILALQRLADLSKVGE